MAYFSCVVQGATLRGVEAVPVSVEVVISNGIPSFSIVGMPDAAIQESRERVRAAIRACGFVMPSDKIVVNLAPASLKKSGTGFDLPIALGLLVATNQIDHRIIAGSLVTGELSLEGQVSAVNGLLAYEQCAKKLNCSLITGRCDKGAVSVSGVNCYAIDRLSRIRLKDLPLMPALSSETVTVPSDFSEVGGHEMAKRALQIAAVGEHGVLMVGPPGSGKTMLARCFPSILPPLDESEIIEAALIRSVLGEDMSSVLAGVRPYCAPHHSATSAGLIGGGSPVRPGEISLAHRGVLFLDELPEFRSGVLQALRQPLEEGVVRLTRAEGLYEFPSRFLLLAAMNPCPCGYFGDPEKECRCSESQIRLYQGKIGGPLLDRIDIRIDVWRSDYATLTSSTSGRSSAEMRDEVVEAKRFALHRTGGGNAYAKGNFKELLEGCVLRDSAGDFLHTMSNTYRMSVRSLRKVLLLSRTIADLERSSTVEKEHVAQACALRFKEGREA